MTIPQISLKRPFMSGLKADREEAGLTGHLPAAILGTAHDLFSVWSEPGKMPLLPGAWFRGIVQGEMSWR